jgi:hypothetical protein
MRKMQDDLSNALLSYKEIARELTRHGYRISPASLQTMATRGDGPVFRKWGHRRVYRLDEALAWAEGRFSAPVTKVSDLHAPAQ